jgi:hypothetical protein
MDITRFTVYLKCSSVSIDTRKIEKKRICLWLLREIIANTFSKEAFE